jgi:hypothetical protein
LEFEDASSCREDLENAPAASTLQKLPHAATPALSRPNLSYEAGDQFPYWFWKGMLACQDTCQDILILVPLCMPWYHLTSHFIQFESLRPQLCGSVMRLSSASQVAGEYSVESHLEHTTSNRSWARGCGGCRNIGVEEEGGWLAGKRSEGAPWSV